MSHLFRLLLEPKAVDGGGDEHDEPTPDVTDESRLDAKKVLARHKGDSLKALAVLLGDNYKQRDRARRVEEEYKAKLPPEGAVVLTGDDAKAWEEYKTLGRPDEVKRVVDEGRKIARDRHREKVAGLLDWDAEVLGTLLDRDGIDPVVEEAKGKDGKAVPAAVVVTRGDDGKEQKVPLAEYADAHWMAKYGDSLRRRKAAQPGTPPNRHAHTPPPERDEDARARIREASYRANRGYHGTF